MYIKTGDGLGLDPMLYGSFAGVLGEPPLSPEIQNFLNRVEKSPQDYEALLLTSIFHVEPFSSDQLRRLVGKTFLATDTSFDEAILRQEKVIQALSDIHARHMRRDKQYSKLVDKEKQLVKVVSEAFQKRIKEIETKYVRWFEELLTEALLAPDPFALAQVGKKFALFILPDQITEQILNSRVPETHYARLGKALQLNAGKRQKDNAAFKKRVEQERKKQGK